MTSSSRPEGRARTMLGALLITSLSLLVLSRGLKPQTHGQAGAPPTSTPSALSSPTASASSGDGYAFTKRLYTASSRDLVHWSTVTGLMDGCDTPQFTWIDRRLFLYFNTKAGFQRAEVIRDSRGQCTLGTRQDLFMTTPSQRGGTDPSVTRLPSGEYRLFYTEPQGSTGVDPAEVTCEVCSALSIDGLIWKSEMGPRFTGQGIVDPEVVRTPDGRFRLYYTGHAGTQVRSAISNDGTKYVAEPGVRVWGGVSSTVRSLDGSYVMLYQIRIGKREGRDPPAHLRLARSSDGFHFRPDLRFQPPPAPVASEGEEAGSLAQTPEGEWLLVFVSAI
ncbi:MAG: hypothetical protein EB084_05510 [Proteobacteria bacterium]|nr:hypothetical protein [Pseudomonadota bacterium]